MVDFRKLTKAAEADPTLAWRMQFRALSVGLSVEGGKHQTLVIGPASIVLKDEAASRPDISLIAKPGAWDAYAEPAPAVGFQSLASLVETEQVRVQADNILDYVQNLMLLEKLFAQLRPGKPQTIAVIDAPQIEPVVGRYVRMNLEGRPHRVYFEEAGDGIPLLCLHTAGSDGRQYRALMNDTDITARFRVIAFDLPWHGKSSPPAGFQNEPYLLTTDRYMDYVMAFVDALKLDRPVVMGCSIGGRAVLHLSLRHGHRFRAAIGLQSATHAQSHTQELLGLQASHILYRPDVHAGEVSAASVMQLMSPTSPPEHEWETLWYYMQGGPGVFQGDLNYYFLDGDLRNGLTDGIDTDKCPLYLLSGEYDLSATPQMGEDLAALVNATHFEVMRGLGHFPMSEDPDRFRTYLLPVLERIEQQAEAA